MLRKWVLASLLTSAAICVVSPHALAHGGTYRGPGDVQGPPDPGGPTTGGGGGGTTTGGGGGGPITGGGGPQTPGGGPGGPPGGPAGGGGGRGGSTGGGGNIKKHAPGEGFESWQFWWEYNKDRFVNVRERLAEAGQPASGTSGFLGGEGLKVTASNSSRPSADEVNTQVIPALKRALSTNEMDIVDSAVLALGRIVKKDAAGTVIDDLKGALASPINSVQQSTIIALGVLGSQDSVPVLVDILNDTASARKALKVNGSVQDLHRAFAALALGYIGSPDTIPILKDAIVKNGAEKKSIRAMAIVALGLFRDEKESIVSFLLDELKDEKLDADTAGQIPVAIGRLGAEAAVPTLLKLAMSRKTTNRVEESAVIALGKLAQSRDSEVIAGLADKIHDGQNDQARHFAIIALADIAERILISNDELTESDRAIVNGISKTLMGELEKAKQKAHEPWAGLALGIVAHAYPENSRERPAIQIALEEKFEKETNPSFGPAYALALGISGCQHSKSKILDVMDTTKERSTKGFCAIALGLLKATDAKETIRKYIEDGADPKFRLQVATSLGLLGDVGATQLLVHEFDANAKTLSVISSLARAIGLIGDGSSIHPLVSLINDKASSPIARGFGCVALGLLAEKTDLPWNAAVSVGINYRTQISSLREVLDIL